MRESHSRINHTSLTRKPSDRDFMVYAGAFSILDDIIDRFSIRQGRFAELII